MVDLARGLASEQQRCDAAEAFYLSQHETAGQERTRRLLREMKASLALLERDLEELLCSRCHAPAGRSLRCEECGRLDVGDRGWTLRLGDDDGLYAFCPDCDSREFGGEA